MDGNGNHFSTKPRCKRTLQERLSGVMGRQRKLEKILGDLKNEEKDIRERMAGETWRKIQVILKKEGLDMQTLSILSGVSKNMILRIRYSVVEPSNDIRVAISKALGVPPSSIWPS